MVFFLLVASMMGSLSFFLFSVVFLALSVTLMKGLSVMKNLLLLESLGLLLIYSMSTSILENTVFSYFVCFTLLVCEASMGLGVMITMTRNSETTVLK